MTAIKASEVFNEVLRRGIKQGMIPNKNETAKEWFRKKAQGVRISAPTLIQGQKPRQVSKLLVGQMGFFQYDPKHKADLPYYDIFPMIFVVRHFEDRFLGLNIHYLPYVLRAKLMDALYSLVSDHRMDDHTRLHLSYEVLKEAAKFKYFKPCLKMYLHSHVKSAFIPIHPQEWDIALFLPIHQFKKAPVLCIWKNSKDIAEGKKVNPHKPMGMTSKPKRKTKSPAKKKN